MTLLPNRISANGSITPQRELELAHGLLEIQSEEELDHFLPLLAAAAPMIANIAGPLLKNLAGGLFGGGGGGGRKRRPRDEQEQFVGNIFKGLLGEAEAQSYEEEQFIGGILKGVLGGETEAETYEQEQFLGGILGKVLGGEMEAESYEQEQFLGGILKGVLGGEMETQGEAEVPPGKLLHRARRFVRLVHMASHHAAAEIAAMQRAGHRPDEHELRRIVFTAIVHATRRLKPRLAAAAFPGGPQMHAAGPGQPPGPPPGQGQGQGPSVLQGMIAESVPFGGGGGDYGGGGARSGRATWVREGNRMIITL